jgi:hypothetical protein
MLHILALLKYRHKTITFNIGVEVEQHMSPSGQITAQTKLAEKVRRMDGHHLRSIN